MMIGQLAERDDGLRAACFAALDVLRARLGEELPLVGGLDQGFYFDGGRVPFLNHMKGIYRARRRHGPAALSVMTSSKSPYGADEETHNGFWYAYRRGAQGDRDNEAMRSAMRLQTPIVYFRSFSPGWYAALYPVYIDEDDHYGQRVLLSTRRRAARRSVAAARRGAGVRRS